MTSAILDNETITRTQTDDGDHDRFAHYYRKDELDKAIFDGVPIRALCGKYDVPTRDPKKYSVCPTCKEIYEEVVQDG